MSPIIEETSPSLAELLSALSRALDMTEGQPRGHAVRTSLVASHLAGELGLGDRERENLFYAALLKDAGCSANSARFQELFGGDDLAAKKNSKLIDWSSPIANLRYAVANTAPGGSWFLRMRKLTGMAGANGTVMQDLTATRCTRGAEIALQLGFERQTAEAIRCLDEHWDGRGAPARLAGDQIPLLARILCLAQTLEVFVCERGRENAYAMLEHRKGRWFDPEIVRAAMALRHDTAFWAIHTRHKANGSGMGVVPPQGALAATEATLDQVCEAFASIVDAKSAFTAAHSLRVTQYAVAIAQEFGMAGFPLANLRRAALLHDIGKLGVSTSILDKPGKLTPEEYAAMKRHTRYAAEILSPIRGFGRLAAIAEAHHERLDGKGYHRRLTASELDLEMRLLAVADVFDALSATRAYRQAIPLSKVFAILADDEGLDQTCVEALRGVTRQNDTGELHLIR